MKLLAIILFSMVGGAFSECSVAQIEPGDHPHIVHCTNITSSKLGENMHLPKDTRFDKISSFYLKGFTGEFDKKTITMFPNLRSAYISESEFPKLTNDMFYGLEKLANMRISGNKFESIEPDTFKNLPELRGIEILNNQNLHMDIDVLRNNKKIEYLGLPASVVKTLDAKKIKEMLPSLRSISVKISEKSGLEEQVKNLKAENIEVLFQNCIAVDCTV